MRKRALTNKETIWYRIRIFCEPRHRADLPHQEMCIPKGIRRAYGLCEGGGGANVMPITEIRFFGRKCQLSHSSLKALA
jgi:hypothetical protein